MTATSYTTPQVSAMTGASFRQLDHWDRCDVLTPTVAEARGSGSQRRYSHDDVRVIRVLVALAALGARGHVLRRVVHTVRFARWSQRYLAITATGPACLGASLDVADDLDACWVLDLHALNALPAPPPGSGFVDRIEVFHGASDTPVASFPPTGGFPTGAPLAVRS